MRAPAKRSGAGQAVALLVALLAAQDAEQPVEQPEQPVGNADESAVDNPVGSVDEPVDKGGSELRNSQDPKRFRERIDPDPHPKLGTHPGLSSPKVGHPYGSTPVWCSTHSPTGADRIVAGQRRNRLTGKAKVESNAIVHAIANAIGNGIGNGIANSPCSLLLTAWLRRQVRLRLQREPLPARTAGALP